jgi:phosphoribosylaminoimidazolecarboxamide formyltransferase/IMP cyclohydrolase
VRVLISVSNKIGLEDFVRGLTDLGASIVSTGNTQRVLAEAGFTVASVQEVTGFPEILGGRVKTLHPAIHGGILAQHDKPEHQQELADHHISRFDMVVVNLYPFVETVARPDVTLAEALENIDIGGVALIRAAAKNYPSVVIVVDPSDYATVMAALREYNGEVPEDLRRWLAAKAFSHTASYDTAIAGYLSDSTAMPQKLTLAWDYAQDMRYGENPHQQAALYGSFFSFFEKLHGKELSYNNIVDIAAAQAVVEEFRPEEGVALSIIKHTNPCGVGVGKTAVEAWERAFATDSQSAFGGIVAVNAPCDLVLAKAIDELFTEVLIAPSYDDDALALLRKKKNRRLLLLKQPIRAGNRWMIRSVPGGVLLQDVDNGSLDDESFTVVTQRTPTDEEVQALRFAWRVARHVKSNAIVYTSTDRTLGIGAGQMSRVDSSYMAAHKAEQAGLSLKGSVVASDAMFPFADGVEVALQVGATAIVQPGGSVRDKDVIAAADAAGAAMVFTGYRHFLH